MGGCLVLSISAWYLLRGKHTEFAQKSLKGGLVLCLLSCLAMFVSGHFQAQMVYKHQPAKMAAFEAHFVTGPGNLSLVGIPDEANETIHMNIEVPGGLSFLLHESFSEEVIGLDKFNPEDRPPVKIPYFAYHIMIGTGVSLSALMVLSAFFWWKGTLFDKRWILWLLFASIVPAIAGNEAGWVATEVGRQPWIVQAPLKVDQHGVRVEDENGRFVYEDELGLRTNDAVSKAITSEQVLASIIMFGTVYFLLGILWIFILNRKIQAGPKTDSQMPEDQTAGLSEIVSKPKSLTEGH
jgi:cytochrome d ubiquinol oxidase subunit I